MKHLYITANVSLATALAQAGLPFAYPDTPGLHYYDAASLRACRCDTAKEAWRKGLRGKFAFAFDASGSDVKSLVAAWDRQQAAIRAQDKGEPAAVDAIPLTPEQIMAAACQILKNRAVMANAWRQLTPFEKLEGDDFSEQTTDNGLDGGTVTIEDVRFRPVFRKEEE